MRSVEYFELASASGKLSDQFYSALTRWTTGGEDNKLRIECGHLARQYGAALEAQRTYLESLELSEDVERALNITRTYIYLLEKDFNNLTKH
jgi:hypothetical protein